MAKVSFVYIGVGRNYMNIVVKTTINKKRNEKNTKNCNPNTRTKFTCIHRL